MMAQKIFIDGNWINPHSKQTREIRNPATLELLGTASDCDKEDVDAAVSSACRAQKEWWKKPGVEKANLLREVAARVRLQEREISTVMAKESGKPLIEAIDCIEWVAACFDYYAELGRSSRGLSLPPVAPHQVNFTTKEPFGAELSMNLG